MLFNAVGNMALFKRNHRFKLILEIASVGFNGNMLGLLVKY